MSDGPDVLRSSGHVRLTVPVGLTVFVKQAACVIVQGLNLCSSQGKRPCLLHSPLHRSSASVTSDPPQQA